MWMGRYGLNNNNGCVIRMGLVRRGPQLKERHSPPKQRKEKLRTNPLTTGKKKRIEGLWEKTPAKRREAPSK